MFENIGGKIKKLAETLCWIGIIFCIIYGIINWVLASDARGDAATTLIINGFIWAILGSILSWVGSFCLYGFGEIIDRLKSIDRKLGQAEIYHSPDSSQKGEYNAVENEENRKNKEATLKELLENGLISEEEYEAKMREN